MKRLMVVAGIMLCCALVGCDSGRTTGDQNPTATVSTTGNPLEAAIEEVTADFTNTAQKLLDEQEALFAEIGDDYESYTAHKDAVQAWYDLAANESEALAERVRIYGRAYYQLVVDNVDVTEDRNWKRATEDFYDAVYDDAYDDYYDTIYEDAFENMYDAYYDGSLADAYDVLPYDEWSDVRSEAYDMWSDARSAVYEAISDGRSDVYGDYTDVYSAFYDNDFDVEGIFAPVEIIDKADVAEQPAPDADSTSSDQQNAAQSVDVSGVTPEFKAAMDEYEAFFGEYVAFMQAYNADPDSADLMSRYPDMLTQYTETMASFNEVDTSSLSTEDYAYYAEVSGRILQMTSELV